MRKLVFEGHTIPRGYGRAYAVDYAMAWVCYPVPLNWIMNWWHRLYQVLARGPHDPLMEAFNRGLDKGREIERSVHANDGYERGQLDGMREILGELQKVFRP